MKGIFTIALLLAAFTYVSAGASINWTDREVNDQEAYIARYKKIAMQEMERSGVPASIKLAQGILESDSGRSYLARTAKNHFGIKCGSNWKGDAVYREDDDYDDRGKMIKSCFRHYRNADASFVAHSEFLRDPGKSFRYGFLFRLEPTDYKAWARGLRKSGYATNPRYPELLISIIDRHNLHQYDLPGSTDPIDIETPVEEAITGILNTNDVRYFISEAPVRLEDIARDVELSVRRLLQYNEALESGAQMVGARERVYLQKKRRAYRGGDRYHRVGQDENLYDIAQRYGLRLSILARRNRLGENADPAAGSEIKLRGGRVREAPALENSATRPRTVKPAGAAAEEDEDGFLDLGQEVISPNPPLIVPDPRPQTAPRQPVIVPPVSTPSTDPNQSAAAYHAVRQGDTLYGISRKYGISVEQLKRLNALTTNTISVGLQLRIR